MRRRPVRRSPYLSQPLPLVLAIAAAPVGIGACRASRADHRLCHRASTWERIRSYVHGAAYSPTCRIKHPIPLHYERPPNTLVLAPVSRSRTPSPEARTRAHGCFAPRTRRWRSCCVSSRQATPLASTRRGCSHSRRARRPRAATHRERHRRRRFVGAYIPPTRASEHQADRSAPVRNRARQ